MSGFVELERNLMLYVFLEPTVEFLNDCDLDISYLSGQGYDGASDGWQVSGYVD